jgi:hypothetical protein
VNVISNDIAIEHHIQIIDLIRHGSASIAISMHSIDEVDEFQIKETLWIVTDIILYDVLTEQYKVL